MVTRVVKTTMHPLEAARPIFCCLPLLVKGTPIFLEMFDFAAEIPIALFQEKPPLPMVVFVK